MGFPTPSGYIYYSFSAGRVTGVSNVGGLLEVVMQAIFIIQYDTTLEQSDTGKGAQKQQKNETTTNLCWLGFYKCLGN